MRRLSLITILVLAVFATPVFGETVTGSVRAGNSLYREGKYEEALKKYKAAQVESHSDERIMFNLGNAQYKLGRYEEALSEYLQSAQMEDPSVQAQSYYNAGNALYRAGKLEEAVEQYLKSLEIDPNDEDSKFNLEFVRREIRRRMNEQQQRQQEQQKEKEQEEKESGDQGAPEQKASRTRKRTIPKMRIRNRRSLPRRNNRKRAVAQHNPIKLNNSSR